jgi:hypothetical protein
MSESADQLRIANYVHEIIQSCERDRVRTDVAIANFESLLTAMRRYEHGPRHFDALVEEAEQADDAPPPIAPKGDKDLLKCPPLADLDQLFGRRLKHFELKKVGETVAEKMGLRLGRNAKRKKGIMLDWFASNWVRLHPKIVELGLHNAPIQANPAEPDPD